MSLTLPLLFTVGAESISLPRTQGPDNRTSLFEFMRADGSRKYTGKIGHIVPRNVSDVRSTVYALTAQDYDTSGVEARGYQVHLVWKSWGGMRVQTDLDNLHTAFLANLSASSAANYFALQNLEV